MFFAEAFGSEKNETRLPNELPSLIGGGAHKLDAAERARGRFVQLFAFE